jgi:isoquinoline 1-oxidoreductase/isoquinoline 1-oxidoreductase beta subunit
MMKIKAAANNEGRITAWQARRSGANITAQTMKNALPGVLPSLPTGLLNGLVGAMDYVFDNWAVDASSVEGLHETYSLPSYTVSHASVDHGLPTTFWRSVGHSYTSFAVESMMDELAEARQIDPVTLRLKNLEDKPRMKNVVAQAGRLMAAMTVPENHHLGFAAHSSFGTDVAQIAQVSVTDDNIRVHNFHNYPILRMNESPAVDVVIINSQTPPTGIGEPGVPPLAPAVANAVYRATGQRLRDLPLKLA